MVATITGDARCAATALPVAAASAVKCTAPAKSTLTITLPASIWTILKSTPYFSKIPLTRPTHSGVRFPVTEQNLGWHRHRPFFPCRISANLVLPRVSVKRSCQLMTVQYGRPRSLIGTSVSSNLSFRTKREISPIRSTAPKIELNHCSLAMPTKCFVLRPRIL